MRYLKQIIGIYDYKLLPDLIRSTIFFINILKISAPPSGVINLFFGAFIKLNICQSFFNNISSARYSFIISYIIFSPAFQSPIPVRKLTDDSFA